MRTLLQSGWTVRPLGAGVPPTVVAAGPVPASVPGSVHTDLLAAGFIDDPYLDDHEHLQAWIGRVDWRYETTVQQDPGEHDRVDLVLDGLDTVAEVEVNGTAVLATRNMHRSYRVPVGELLRPGDNTVTVTFRSPVRYADAASLALGARPHVNHHPYNAIRKMACSFGWDWGPDTATSGIWRPVSLHTWSTARLASVRPVATVAGDQGTVDVHVDLEREGEPGEAVLQVMVAGVRAEVGVPAGETSATVRVEAGAVRRWWPQGHGEQPLYDVQVTLVGRGRELDRWGGRLGFRTVRVDTTTDDEGTPFTLVVNDRPLFVKGVNWIPDDAFPHRVSRQRYAARLQQAQDAGVNLVRVWGGGIYESEDFYAECDERGLMVWQDFLFACAAYSEEEPLHSEVEAEAREAITRLVPHPSLVLWNGNNENLWGHEDWDWKSRLDGKSWGSHYYHDLLPMLVAELDPGRPYTPGSPFSPGLSERHPNDPDHGSMHVWDVWNDRDWTAYREHRPRFAAEFGWQAPPTWTSLRRSVSDDPLTPESPGMLVHQKAMEGDRKLVRGLVAHQPVPDDMDDWHWAMQLNQARAVQTAVEHFRSLWPRCTGSVYWQMNDCWPVTSWSVVDGDGRVKPSWYALRHAHADRLLTIQPRGRTLVVWAGNDTDTEWTGDLVVTRRSLDGETLDRVSMALAVPARDATTVEVPVGVSTPSESAGELLTVQVGGQRACWWFVEDRELEVPPARFDAVAERAPGGYRVTVTAKTLVRDLALLVDRVDPAAVVDDMLVTLLPGETVTFRVTSEADLEPRALTDPLVLRCAHQTPREPGPQHPDHRADIPAVPTTERIDHVTR